MIGLIILSLNSHIGDPRIESQVGRVDENFPRDSGPTVNQS